MNSYRKDELIFYKAGVISQDEIAPGVYYLRFEKCIDFIAGQVSALSMGKGLPHRLYSIASGNDDDFIGILFDIQPQGYLTPLLSKLRKGDTLYISDAFGKFNDKPGKAYWIAGGTGIAPFLSMLRSGLFVDKTLILGGRDSNSFYFSEEFEDVEDTTFIRCISREKSPEFFNGRITDYLHHENELPLDCPYFLCGNAEMVVDVRDVLIEKGVPFENINAEIYF